MIDTRVESQSGRREEARRVQGEEGGIKDVKKSERKHVTEEQKQTETELEG